MEFRMIILLLLRKSTFAPKVLCSIRFQYFIKRSLDDAQKIFVWGLLIKILLRIRFAEIVLR